MRKMICIGIILGFVVMSVLPVFAQNNDDTSRNILKEGILGAATGAVAAGASGGKAGKGALIGAGTNVIGGALLDTMTGPSQKQVPQQAPVYVTPAPQPVYVTPVPQPVSTDYQRGYQDGFRAGYQEGLNARR